MNECFFCGPTERPLTDEHVWPKWVSKLLQDKYGADHFVHIRSTGSSTEGYWKSPHLQVTIDSLCETCSPAGRGTEVVLACNILNQMTGLGRPMSYRIGR